MIQIETTVLYINKDDLVNTAKTLNIEQIEWYHVKHTEDFLTAGVVILSMNGKYKVLKSREI